MTPMGTTDGPGTMMPCSRTQGNNNLFLLNCFDYRVITSTPFLDMPKFDILVMIQLMNHSGAASLPR